MRVSSLLGRNASCCDFKQLFPRLAGVALHGGTGAGGPLNEERFGQLLIRSDPVRQTPYLCKTCCACLWHMRNETRIVAEAIGLGESTFRSLHRNTLRGSPGKHLRGLRLSTAEKLLSTTGESIAEVSRMVGYRHPESFCTAFKAVHGQTPGGIPPLEPSLRLGVN